MIYYDFMVVMKIFLLYILCNNKVVRLQSFICRRTKTGRSNKSDYLKIFLPYTYIFGLSEVLHIDGDNVVDSH